MKARGGLTQAQFNQVAAVLAAYREGWFPMYDDERDRVDWVQPHQRAVFTLDPAANGFRVPRSLQQRVKSARFEIRCDTAFRRVIRECAKPRADDEGTWLHESIIDAFELMHTLGYVHSIEAWRDPPRTDSLSAAQSNEKILVGGLYGVQLGSIFCGESMFSRPDLGGTDASKVCLVHLVSHLRARGFALLDSQIMNPHIAQFGAHEIDDTEYAETLARFADKGPDWGTFDPNRAVREMHGPR